MALVESFGSPEGFTPSGFTEEVYANAIDSLMRIKQIFSWHNSKASLMKEQHVARMLERWKGEENFVEMKRTYTNGKLEDLLANKHQIFSVWDNHLIRKTGPIYQVPRSRIARAHLFSPIKRVGSLSFDTFWFNLAVIWLSAVILYLTLVYDLLRKFTNWNQIRKLRKSS